MRVYQAVARAIMDEGVDPVFTLLGDAVLECLGELDRAGVTLYQAHHEGAGLAMADGYARASGRVGVCAVTWGPGLTNATLALAQAVRAGSPVVVLTGRLENRHLSQHFEHQPLAAATGAGFLTVATPAGALPAVGRAFHQARTQRRPVVLELPHDVQLAELPAEYGYRAEETAAVPAGRLQPDPAAVATAAGDLSRSARPVIIAGRGALAAGARDAVLALGDHTGALLATTLPVRGWFDGEPFDIGLAGGYSRPLAKELFAGADCVVAVGASLTYYTLAGGGTLFPAARVIQVDLRGEHRMGDDRRADGYLQGDAAVTAAALRAATTAGERYRTAGVRERIAAQRVRFDEVAFDLEPGRTDPREILSELDDALPVAHRIVFGGGHQRELAAMYLHRWRGPQLFTTGAIGQGLSLAAGAALSPPRRPTVVVEGDGGVLMHIQELASLRRYRVPVLLLVMNNAALGTEFYKLPAQGFRAGLAEIPETDFAAVAGAFGVRAVTVTGPAQVRPVVEQFLADPVPTVADVRISRSVVGIPYRARIASIRKGRPA
jgi:thiamine pyrophosphate-dependent acetolactate synthase large subunit-like protein